MKFLIIIGLFTAKRITLEKAVELTGKSIWNFVDTLKEHQIPWGEYTEEDMQMDELAIKKLAGGMYGYSESDGMEIKIRNLER